MRTDIRIKRLDKNLPLPKFESLCAVGLDLRSRELSETIEPGQYCRFGTGIAIEIPTGYEGQVRPRSSWAEVLDYWHLGTIDGDFRGEIHVCFRLNARKRIEYGDRIAQLVIGAVAPAVRLIETDELSVTERGASGFGSTGAR